MNRNTYTKNLPYYGLTALCAISLGIFIGYTISQQAAIDDTEAAPIRANDPAYKFVNPLLSCNISETKEFSEYTPLKQSLEKNIASYDSKKINDISIYYRDLNTGRWFGVHDDELYSPASLMKVPILIAYLKKAEKDASFLYKVLPITTKESADSIAAHEIFTKHAPVVAGESYTTNDLLTRMVQYSDNTALNALVDNIDQDSLIEVASDVDIRIPENASVGASDFLTAKSYSYLFRLLYNSTYLRKDLSEKALSMLADTDFTEGLRANIPDTVAIAHKFGERTFIAPDGKTIGRELHDCGIVYYPGHPYLLCIMSKGSDFIALSQAVQDISAHIYTAMQKDYN